MNWIEGKTSEDISQAQDQDRCIEIIKTWKMSSETRPRYMKHISHQGRIVKAYWSQWDRLVIVDNVLYRLWWEQGKKQPLYQLVLPQNLRDLALSQLHNQATSGHMGSIEPLLGLEGDIIGLGIRPIYVIGVPNVKSVRNAKVLRENIRAQCISM